MPQPAARTATSARRSPRHLVEHALSLIGRQQHGEPVDAEAARQELSAWRKADPAHDAAFETARQYWSATDASALRDSVPLPRRSGRDAAAQATRRRVLATLGLAGLTTLLGTAGWRWLRPDPQYELATGHGQVLARDLPDGSHIDLGANTLGRIGYYRDRREVQLANGEMRFDVRSDRDRPFIVVTAWGRVAVLGTVFSVAVRGPRMRVEVAEGRVAVWATDPAGAGSRAAAPPGMVLEASEAVEIDGRGLGSRTFVRPQSVGAWRDGWLIFNGTPLPEAVARWNDYLPRPLQLADSAALRDLRLTGSFPAREPDAFVRNLPEMLPVRIAQEGGALVLYPRR